MPDDKPLAVPADTIYAYDGSYHGFLCCVFKSVYSGELPADIVTFKNEPLSLFPIQTVETDVSKATRVLTSIPEKISNQALSLIETVFLSCMPKKELAMLRFLLRGYKQGGRLLSMLGDPDVAPLLKAEKHLLGEVHLLKGFVRFADYDGVLAGTISPKNFVLPFIAGHFTQRFSNEDFLIFDKTHKAALVYKQRKKEIISVDDIQFPPVSESEQQYQNMWKQFYNTISIKARENPRCRMTLMPKRYWENMTEMQEAE